MPILYEREEYYLVMLYDYVVLKMKSIFQLPLSVPLSLFSKMFTGKWGASTSSDGAFSQMVVTQELIYSKSRSEHIGMVIDK